MTDSARYGDYSPAAAGTPFEPRPGGVQAPPGGGVRSGWNGDHEADEAMAGWDGDQVEDGLRANDDWAGAGAPAGVDPVELTDDDLLREMNSLHRTRLDTLRHGTDAALANHLRRTADLETEYLTRHPGREVDPARLRDGR